MVVAAAALAFVYYYYHHRHTELIVAPPSFRTCPAAVGNNNHKLVVYIPSPIPWHARRRRVLEQFQRDRVADVDLLFILGTRQGGPALEEEADGLDAARFEARRHRHVARYLFTPCRDYGDEYNNANGTSSTTCKVYEALRYIAHAYAEAPPRFVWRGADDSYLDLRVFRTHVQPRLQTCRLFLGLLRFPDPRSSDDLLLADRQPNLYALYGLTRFGKYMLGAGFCMSWDVVHFLGTATIPPRQTWCEDVMVGQWLLFYNVDFVDIATAAPGVLMLVNAAGMPAPHLPVLLAHKMDAAQWDALARRPS